jgi:two-component system OmpR family sensor kinase
MLARLSLRARLVLGVIMLSAIGLAAANVATYASLRAFLLDRTDASLDDSSGRVARSLYEHVCPSAAGPPLRGVDAGDYVELRDSDGDVLCSYHVTRFLDAAPSPPQLPESVAPLRPGDDELARYFTVPAREGGERYRVRASAELGSDATLVIATSLDDVDATLRRLLAIELLVTAAVLTALAALGLWVVRLGLRPLAAIGSTAAAIAAGDLSRRVERAEPHTEVGRLGLALNAMLAQIESAFRAQAASEQKLRRFVADASHELRTPLAAVRAYAELFARGAERRPDDLARSMEGISRESERMSVLVDDLLLLARLDEGRPLAREPVELDAVVGEAVETALTVEPDRPIAFEAERAAVLGDRDRLRQIVDNLLSNVRAHTPPGAPVRVQVSRANGSAVIEVADSGPGISADETERVFERFYRADQTRSRASGGVGLGLSIVAAVAEAHGGSVAATSEPGRGATFRIVLPVADQARNGSDGRSPPNRLPTTPDTEGDRA